MAGVTFFDGVESGVSKWTTSVGHQEASVDVGARSRDDVQLEITGATLEGCVGSVAGPRELRCASGSLALRDAASPT